jgi:hypothetical protein
MWVGALQRSHIRFKLSDLFRLLVRLRALCFRRRFPVHFLCGSDEMLGQETVAHWLSSSNCAINDCRTACGNTARRAQLY